MALLKTVPEQLVGCQRRHLFPQNAYHRVKNLELQWKYQYGYENMHTIFARDAQILNGKTADGVVQQATSTVLEIRRNRRCDRHTNGFSITSI